MKGINHLEVIKKNEYSSEYGFPRLNLPILQVPKYAQALGNASSFPYVICQVIEYDSYPLVIRIIEWNEMFSRL